MRFLRFLHNVSLERDELARNLVSRSLNRVAVRDERLSHYEGSRKSAESSLQMSASHGASSSLKFNPSAHD